MFCLISFCSACSLFCKDDELSFGRIDHDMTKLKVHSGYYYGDSTLDNGTIGVNALYLYQNGVWQDIGGIDLGKWFTKDLPQIPQAASHVTIWGLFKVESNSITLERWHQLSTGCLTTLVKKGRVLNDTTFVITLRERYKNGRASSPAQEVYNIYRFRASKNKPDSTNNFIK